MKSSQLIQTSFSLDEIFTHLNEQECNCVAADGDGLPRLETSPNLNQENQMGVLMLILPTYSWHMPQMGFQMLQVLGAVSSILHSCEVCVV